MIDPGLAAVIAAGVSLVLGVVSIWRSSSDSRTLQRREERQRRADGYVRVLKIVETRGLAVQDQMYNLTERGEDAYDRRAPTMPKRELSMPPRTDRAEARAYLAAYGTRAGREAFERWLSHIDSWEQKIDNWSFEYELNGPSDLSPEDAEPERSAEYAARSAFGEAVRRDVGGGVRVHR